MQSAKIVMNKLFIALLVLSCSGRADAQNALPRSAKSCQDVRAFVSPDNSMTMETFKALLTAAGADLSKGGDKSLDLQCKTVPYVKQAVMMSQHVLTKADGGEVRINSRITLDNGVCKLVDIAIGGC